VSTTAGTAAGHRRRFVGGYLAVLLSLLVALSAFGMLTPDSFFIGAFVCYLLLVEFTASNYLVPDWRRPLRWLALFGYLVFGVLVVRYLLDVIQAVAG